jgi:hypothetical protein
VNRVFEESNRLDFVGGDIQTQSYSHIRNAGHFFYLRLYFRSLILNKESSRTNDELLRNEQIHQPKF